MSLLSVFLPPQASATGDEASPAAGEPVSGPGVTGVAVGAAATELLALPLPPPRRRTAATAITMTTAAAPPKRRVRLGRPPAWVAAVRPAVAERIRSPRARAARAASYRCLCAD